VSKHLKSLLDGAVRVSTLILTNAHGRPWTSDGFRTSWAKTCVKAAVPNDLHFHDLRRSAVVRLAIAGATVPEIATFTGHSLKDVEAEGKANGICKGPAILGKHYLGRLAENAVRKLERKEKRTESVKGR
jgi:integrase